MRNASITLTMIAALTLGALGTAEAQNKGRRDGAHEQRPTSMQHRASSRKFQHAVDRRQTGQHARGTHTRSLEQTHLAYEGQPLPGETRLQEAPALSRWLPPGASLSPARLPGISSVRAAPEP